MAHISNFISSSVQSITRSFLSSPPTNLLCVRYASKKSGGSTRNKPIRIRPKHRGLRVQDGTFVQAGTILATQLNLRFHPGLHVGLGRNGTLFAMEAGKVMITCEKINPNWSHTWVTRHYAGRENDTIYKKHFNVIPQPQHDRFKLINLV